MQSTANRVGVQEDGPDADHLLINTLGFDIGTATSHLMAVQLLLQRVNGVYVVISREEIFRSPIMLTPYRDDASIDAGALGEFLALQKIQAKKEAGDFDTTVVLMTGAASLPENAERLSDAIPGGRGSLSICAGDRLEAEFCARGSGAVSASSGGRHVLGVDIGGATTKFAWCHDGRMTRIVAYDFGARLVSFSPDARVVRMSRAGFHLGELCGVHLAIGEYVAESDRQRLAGRLADGIEAVIKGGTLPEWTRDFYRGGGTGGDSALDSVVVSGGVGSLIESNEERTFGDLGRMLGTALGQRLRALDTRVHIASEALRSTALGLSKFAVQVSGASVLLRGVELPFRNVPIVRVDSEAALSDSGSGYIGERVESLGLGQPQSQVALMIAWSGRADFDRIDRLCLNILHGLSAKIDAGLPTLLVVDSDLGRALALHLIEELGLVAPIMSIDGVDLRDLDFIDLAYGGANGDQITVTVKSLDFQANAAQWMDRTSGQDRVPDQSRETLPPYAVRGN